MDKDKLDKLVQDKIDSFTGIEFGEHRLDGPLHELATAMCGPYYRWMIQSAEKGVSVPDRITVACLFMAVLIGEMGYQIDQKDPKRAVKYLLGLIDEYETAHTKQSDRSQTVYLQNNQEGEVEVIDERLATMPETKKH